MRLMRAARVSWKAGLGLLALLPAAVLAESSFGTQAQGQVSASAHLRIVVQVQQYTSSRVVSAPRTLEIRPEDVQRGFVDVAEATVLLVRSNTRGGVAIRPQFDASLVSAVTLQQPGEAALFPLAGGTLMAPGSHLQETSFALRWRLTLAPQASAGTYPWPLRIQVQSL